MLHIHEISRSIGQFWKQADTVPLEELGNTLVDVVKWSVSQIGRNNVIDC